MTYSVILADPPWEFQVWKKETGSNRSPSRHYSTMTTAEICALNIPAADNCALFLWACWPTIKDAFAVIEAWGFEYKTLAWEWVKFSRSGLGFHFGMGYYTRQNPEPCLLAVRGRMPVAAHDIQALIVSPVREHSRKPDEQYTKIEALYPGASYLEMFARRPRAGWAVWGNQVESEIQITS